MFDLIKDIPYFKKAGSVRRSGRKGKAPDPPGTPKKDDIDTTLSEMDGDKVDEVDTGEQDGSESGVESASVSSVEEHETRYIGWSGRWSQRGYLMPPTLS